MAWADTADDILTEAGISGGVIVHLGCGTGELTSALGRRGEYLVHGLDRDAANVEAARRRFVEKGQHGTLTAECWTQRTLPLIDNLVNLVVVEDAGDITLQLWFNRGNEEVIEAVEEQWETNLGVNVNVVNMEWGAYLETLDLCNN